MVAPTRAAVDRPRTGMPTCVTAGGVGEPGVQVDVDARICALDRVDQDRRGVDVGRAVVGDLAQGDAADGQRRGRDQVAKGKGGQGVVSDSRHWLGRRYARFAAPSGRERRRTFNRTPGRSIEPGITMVLMPRSDRPTQTGCGTLPAINRLRHLRCPITAAPVHGRRVTPSALAVVTGLWASPAKRRVPAVGGPFPAIPRFSRPSASSTSERRQEAQASSCCCTDPQRAISSCRSRPTARRPRYAASLSSMNRVAAIPISVSGRSAP